MGPGSFLSVRERTRPGLDILASELNETWRINVGNFHRMMNLRLRKRGRFSFARKKKVFTNQFITPPAWMLRKQSGFSFLQSFAARLCTPWPLFFFDATRKCAPAFLCLCVLWRNSPREDGRGHLPATRAPAAKVVGGKSHVDAMTQLVAEKIMELAKRIKKSDRVASGRNKRI
jgi:hypothetical protein